MKWERINDAMYHNSMHLAAKRQQKSIQQRIWKKEYRSLLAFENLIYYNLETSDAVLTNNNDIQIFIEGNELFNVLKETIEKATVYIHIQYYIIRYDEMWMEIEKILLKKAKQGVEVRILYDAMGSRQVPKSHWKKIKKSGIQVAAFFPPIIGKVQLKLNYRNHRKIIVVDGKVGFLGGFNIGREYLGKKKKFGKWRDTHLQIMGAAVTSLTLRFALDWNYATRENIFTKNHLFQIPKYEKYGNTALQIIASGPHSNRQQIRNNYIVLISQAKHHIYIQSPYFIPDRAMMDVLKRALKRGVKVRIMIPCKPDHMFVYWATYGYVGELINRGAKCYIYENGFLHSKVLTVDGNATCCGTANMDIRSFKLNFEVNATVYNQAFTKEMEELFRKDIKKSKYITKKIYNRRGIKIRVKEKISQIFTPIL